MTFIYDKIWKPRCGEIIEFKKSQGIRKLDKRKRFHNITKDKSRELILR